MSIESNEMKQRFCLKRTTQIEIQKEKILADAQRTLLRLQTERDEIAKRKTDTLVIWGQDDEEYHALSNMDAKINNLHIGWKCRHHFHCLSMRQC